jgi:hypothetical protein
MSQAVVQANAANHAVIAIPVTSIQRPTTSLRPKRMGPSLTRNLKDLQRRKWAGGSAVRDATA